MNRCAAVMAGRRNHDVCSVHASNTERVDGAEGIQNVLSDFDPMPGCCLCEGVGEPEVSGMRIEVDESVFVEPDGCRMMRHCQVLAVCGEVSS